jgi:DNA-binding LacI/PurR family transcriptional regulator
VDGEQGISNAIDYLASLGHTKIAYITPPGGLVCYKQRWNGYIMGMEKNNLSIHEDYIIPGEFSENCGFICGKRLFELSAPPTAILTSNDVCAFGVMRATQKFRLVPGKDVSIIGFDDIALSKHWQPALTTISQPFRTIGFSLMQSLLSVLEDGLSVPQLIITPELIVRNSTGVSQKR